MKHTMDIKFLHNHFLDSNGITTDSRNVQAGQLFFALSGQNFNGNQFAEDAISNGAKLAIIDDEKFKKGNNYFLAQNVLECLQELASYHRKYLGIPLIAITGTNGKTTTKELIRSVLQKKFKVAFTHGNLNNQIGVPLTLLSFNKETEIAVVEMGANHQNEIAQLCKIAEPDFGIINNIGKAHLEGFGSFEGVISAKNELYQYCRDTHKKVFVNGNDKLLMELSSGMERIIYGKDASFLYHAGFLSSDPFLALNWNNYAVKTQLVGDYNLNNVIAAIAVGNFFNVPQNEIIDAIEAYKPQNNRSQLLKTKDNTLIIDAYNANPSSMDLAISNFSNISDKNKMLILGDMLELGENSIIEHQKLVELALNQDFKKAIFVGKNFFAISTNNIPDYQFFRTTDLLIAYLMKNKIKNHTILLKASRGVQLERIIEFL
jgi:UDP-N-acetylmuramoyl-tripeptide--D-alanyl-D-alanine ligase